MANKKNKKKNTSKAVKKVSDKLSNDNQAAEAAYENNVERISGAILLDKELNQKTTINFPVPSVIKVFKATKMLFHVTIVESGAIESVTPCPKKLTNIIKTTRTIQRLPGTAYTAP